MLRRKSTKSNVTIRKFHKKICVLCQKKFTPTGTFCIRCKPCRKLHQRTYIKIYNEENKDKINLRMKGEYARKRREKFPEKSRARDMVNNAVKSGKLIKLPCEECGSTKRVNGHHDDYSKPLKVVWLCPQHHKLKHI